MRIAHLTKDLPSQHPNGVSVQVHRLANEQVLRGHSVTVFSLDSKPADARYDVFVHRPKGHVTRIAKLFEPAVFFRGQNYKDFDAIHAHGDNYLITHPGIPMLRTFYGSALWEFWYDHRPGYRIRQLLFYPLEWIAGHFSTVSIGISKITQVALPFIQNLIPCSLDDTVLASSASKTAFPSLLMVGNLSGRKRGWEIHRQFLDKILPQHPDARLILVTRETVPPHPKIELVANPSNEELVKCYQKSWVFCMASSYEGFGVPVAEAMSAGAVVVATDFAHKNQIIEHMKTGIVSPVHEIYKWVIKLFEEGDLRQKISRSASDGVEKYSIRLIADAYQAIYDKILE